MFGPAPSVPRTNLNDRKTAAPRAARCGASALFILSLLWGSLSGCSVLTDPDRKQCSENSDCLALGFTGSTCSAGFCQGPDSRMEMVTASLEAGIVTGNANNASAPLTDASRLDAMTSTGPIGGGESGAQPGPLDGGSQTLDANSVAAVDACSGAACPECSVNADCERRGVAGGLCADGRCWASAPECSVDNDCNTRGAEYVGGRCLSMQCRPNPRWRCEPPPPPPETGMKQLQILLRDSLSLDPLANIKALICPKLDLSCSAPIGEAKTQADGQLTLTVPNNFAGYLKVEEASYQPAMYFLPPVFPADGVLQPFPLLKSGIIVDALAFALGATIDPKRGHMMLIAEDCLGAALSGVKFASPQRDQMAVQFYVRDLLPSTSATETAEIGNGGYLNFPAGTAVLNLTKADNGLKLTTVSVLVRPNFISVAYIRPDRR